MSMRAVRIRFFVMMTIAVASFFTASPARAQNGTWSTVTGLATSPSPRREMGAVYDAASQKYFIFCGATEPYLLFNEVWVLDTSGAPTWTHLDIPGAVPGERHSPQWGFDAARHRVLIFGGYGRHYPGDAYAYLNDVWQLSLDGTPQWTEIFPSGQAPSGRLAGAAVYDPMRQRFVGFGGTVGVPVDTWSLNLRGQANWQNVPSSGTSPNGGYGMTSVYDARKDRMLIFGGSLNDQYYGSKNDVWELDLRGTPTWKQVIPSGTLPEARRSGIAIFDPLRNRMVIYGGFDALPNSDQFLSDTWALDLNGAAPSWSQLSPAGVLPSQRDVPGAAYDPIHDRLVMFGGWSGTAMLGDTDFLDWSGTSSDAALAASGTATPTSAHVQWNVQAATGTHAAVYRRDPGGEWTSLADAEVDATNHMVYDDASVTAGSQYDYMMVVASQRGETFGGQATVAVPTTLGVDPTMGAAFALERVAPNPAVDHMGVSFRLATSEAAKLELLDVAGRIVMSRDVSAFGIGAHRVDIVTAGQLREGLYFVRLSQGSHVASSRVAITSAR